MKKCVLGEFADLIPGVSYTPDGIAASGIRILRGGNINSSELQLKEDDVILSESYQCKDNEVHEGDTIVVASSGSADAFGKAATSWVDLPGVQIGAFLRIVRPRKREYAALVSAWVTQPIFQRYIGSVAKGTGINNIRKEYIEKYPINVDDSGLEQFSELYESICKKIALNRKRIATLEAMAKEIYDYWFVQFDFPDAHGRPYKSSGGAMVYNPDLKREIPKGWEVVKLPQTADFLFGYPFDSSRFNSRGEGMRIVRIRNVKDGYSNDFTTEEAPSEYIIRNGDLLVGMDGYFDMNIWVGGDAYLVQRSCRVKAKDSTYQGYVRRFVAPPIKQLEKTLLGATVAHLGKTHLDDIDIVVPPKGMRAFQMLNDLDASIVQQGLEVAKLVALRDFLLPLLMNGQVKVA